MKLALDLKDEEAFEHLVPLSRQAADAGRAMRRLTARASYVFPGQRHSHRPLSENAIGYLYNRVGFHSRHVPHGWRASFSTFMNARAVTRGRHADEAVIELILPTSRRTRSRPLTTARHMERRRWLLQEWADILLDGLEPASALLTGPRR